jgi:hypothetical protein
MGDIKMLTPATFEYLFDNKLKRVFTETLEGLKMRGNKRQEKQVIDINEFGDYRLGLTGKEIQDYLFCRAPRRNQTKLRKDFVKTAGCNTGALTSTGISLMYRHDVKRFADVVLLKKKTYFD